MPSALPWRSCGYQRETKGIPMAKDEPAKPRKTTAPSSTGTETRNAACVALSCSCSRKCGAKALISPHAAKQMANDRVASASCGPDLGEELRMVIPDQLTKLPLAGESCRSRRRTNLIAERFFCNSLP